MPISTWERRSTDTMTVPLARRGETWPRRAPLPPAAADARGHMSPGSEGGISPALSAVVYHLLGRAWPSHFLVYIIRCPCGSAAQRRNEHTVVPGRAAPSQTLPRVGAWGNPVSPCPCGAGVWGNPVSPHPSSRTYVHVRSYAVASRQGAGRAAGPPRTVRFSFPARGGCAVGVSPGILAAAGAEAGYAGRCSLPAPLHPVTPLLYSGRRGMGKPGFPIPLPTRGRRRLHARRREGEPGFATPPVCCKLI